MFMDAPRTRGCRPAGGDTSGEPTPAKLLASASLTAASVKQNKDASRPRVHLTHGGKVYSAERVWSTIGNFSTASRWMLERQL